MTPEALRAVMLEAQHRYGRLAKVPIEVFDAILVRASAVPDASAVHEAHRAEGVIWDSTCSTCQAQGHPFER